MSTSIEVAIVATLTLLAVVLWTIVGIGFARL